MEAEDVLARTTKRLDRLNSHVLIGPIITKNYIFPIDCFYS